MSKPYRSEAFRRGEEGSITHWRNPAAIVFARNHKRERVLGPPGTGLYHISSSSPFSSIRWAHAGAYSACRCSVPDLCRSYAQCSFEIKADELR